MDRALYARLIDRLDQDPSISNHAEYVLAACEGSDALEGFIGGAIVERPEIQPTKEEVESAGAFLRSISVQGFRGVGPRTTLDLTPGPGLTLVVGRNGSGKSSLAEGLEVLLTGDSYRWKDRVKVWRDGWRNLHQGESSSVSAEILIEDDRALTTINRSWLDAADDVEESEVVVQSQGKRRTELASLGWDVPLEAFRPFLTYSELGSMLEEGPSRLYDTISSILGLGDLVAAEKVLRDARLARKRAHDAASAKLTPLLRQLEEQEDERAKACLEALSSRSWNLDVVEQQVLGLGGAEQEGELQLLRQISVLETARSDEVEAAAAKLDAAVGQLDELAGTDADRAQQVADLLEDALRFHERHGNGDCPVCGRQAALNPEWRERSTAEIDRLRTEARAVQQTRDAVDRAMAHARRFLGGPPSFLLDSERVRIDSRNLRDAWGAWQEGADLKDPRAVATHLRERLEPLVRLADEARAAALADFKEREDLWRPMAQLVADWLAEARPAQESLGYIPGLKKAEEWIKAAQAEIRDERFAPIATEALGIWEQLRTQSSVQLAQPTLEGTGNRRRVRLDVTVDGVGGAALAVMSQGELHSLALSLFLPRVTMSESPFRFIVIDDPVQSMDPARVDGLARVLEKTATARQVVVFTHDDRLPAAVRWLGIDAHVIEVTRRPDSLVELRPGLDPVRRYFADAYAIVKTENLPPNAARRVVPGLCRSGIEAACVEAFRRRRLGRGEPHADVEDTLSRATTTTTLASLALFDNPDRGGDVMAVINHRFGRREADAFRATRTGAHHGYDGDLADLVRDSEELAKGVRELQ